MAGDRDPRFWFFNDVQGWQPRDAGPYVGHAIPPRFSEPHVIMVEERAWDRVHRERDELRERLLNRDAEVEGLETERAGDDLAIDEQAQEIERLRADNDGLRSAHEIMCNVADGRKVEIERLRTAIRALPGPLYQSLGMGWQCVYCGTAAQRDHADTCVWRKLLADV